MPTQTVLYQSPNLLVYDDLGGMYRNMILGPDFKFRQGAMRINAPEILCLEVYKNCFFPICFVPIRKALILGTGTGAIGKAIKRVYPNAIVDFVDIHLEVIQVANHFFALSNYDFRFFNIDAQDFVKKCQEKYDYILVDIWSDTGVPNFILSDDFWANITNLLAPEYGLAVNASGSVFKELASTMCKHFDRIYSMNGTNATFVNFGLSNGYATCRIDMDYQSLVDIDVQALAANTLEIRGQLANKKNAT